ncbi:MAG: DUF6127 family protein [Alphaproteobacteria bacterium]
MIKTQSADACPQICRMPPDVLEEFLATLAERSAEAGAKKALEMVGLGDKYALQDIAAVRELIKNYQNAKRTFWKTLFKSVGQFFAVVTLLGMLALCSNRPIADAASEAAIKLFKP